LRLWLNRVDLTRVEEYGLKKGESCTAEM